MSCINKIQIQQYIDNELSGNEKARIEQHISVCTNCSSLLNRQQQRIQKTKQALNTLVPEEITVPVFTSAAKTAIVRTLSLRKKVIYSVSAACMALMVAGVCYTLQDKKTDKMYIVNSVGTEVNANLPVSQQEMIINVVDPEGNVTEYPIK